LPFVAHGERRARHIVDDDVEGDAVAFAETARLGHHAHGPEPSGREVGHRARDAIRPPAPRQSSRFPLAPFPSAHENHWMRALVVTAVLVAASPMAALAQRAIDDPPPPAPTTPRYTGPDPMVLSGMGAWRRQVLSSGSFVAPSDLVVRRAPRRRAYTGANAVVNDATNDYEPKFPLMTYQVGPSVAALDGDVLVGFSDSYGIQDFVTGVTSYGYSTDGGTTWVDA